MNGEALIDLDLAPPPAARSRRQRARIDVAGDRRRLLRAAAVLVTVGLVLAGSAAPRPSRFAGPVRIPGVRADAFVLTDDAVLVRAGAWQELRSYALDGRLRWAVAPPMGFFTPVGGLGDAVVVTSPAPGQTAALDRRTGALRWRVDGTVFTIVGEAVILGLGGAHGAAGGLAAAPDEEIDELAAVGMRDGRQRWRAGVRPTGAQRRITMVQAAPIGGWPRSGYGLIEPDGTGQLLDLASGRWRRLTGLSSGTTEGTVDYGFTVEDLIVVFSVDNSGMTDVRVYGPTGESPLWSVRTDEPSIAMCGPWLCVPGLGNARVLDVRTGVERRRVDWPWVLAGTGRRLLGYHTAGSIESTQVAVIDSTSGRVLRQYAGWNVISARFTEWIPMLRPDTGQRWRIATLRLADGVAYPLGTLDAVGDPHCRATATHVACVSRNGEVLVWGYRPAR